MRSSAPRGSDSARWMPRASSHVRVAARRHAVSVTASGTRTLGSSSLVRPKSRRIGEALTLRLSTHAMRCGSTQPCTDGAMTARLCPVPGPSGRPAGVRPPERARASKILISRRISKGRNSAPVLAACPCLAWTGGKASAVDQCPRVVEGHSCTECPPPARQYGMTGSPS